MTTVIDNTVVTIIKMFYMFEKCSSLKKYRLIRLNDDGKGDKNDFRPVRLYQLTSFD